jgi:hypothetical protein
MMALIKHVVEEVLTQVETVVPVLDDEGAQIGERTIISHVSEMVGRDVEMTPEEEAEFLASQRPSVDPTPSPPTKLDLKTELDRIAAQIAALT